MRRKAVLLVVLVTMSALLVGVGPVAGQPPDATTVSGYECLYPSEPLGWQTTGQVTRLNQVMVGYYVSNDPTVLPDGTATSVVNVSINPVSGTGRFHRAVTWVPTEGGGTFEARQSGWFRTGPAGELIASHSSTTFQGTGKFKGLTMRMEFLPGDPGSCEERDYDVFDSPVFSGFIVPSGK